MEKILKKHALMPRLGELCSSVEQLHRNSLIEYFVMHIYTASLTFRIENGLIVNS